MSLRLVLIVFFTFISAHVHADDGEDCSKASGDTQLAASDYAESQKFKPESDKAIMLYLARVRSGNDAKEELTLNLNGVDD